ncbi:MAG TPA: hypothetical protein VFR10_13345, partial [bacterium]|nr:hypothetical protein [bacterium]
TEWVFRLLLATFVGAAAFLFWAKIDHVVSGPAVVRRVADAGGQPTLEIIALLPGNTRAQLREGQAMSVRWSGAALSSLPLQVEKIAADIVGPDRARELLGAELSGILQVQGPVVFVSAALPAPTSSTALVPGNSGVAEVRIGRHRLYEELFSGAAR